LPRRKNTKQIGKGEGAGGEKMNAQVLFRCCTVDGRKLNRGSNTESRVGEGEYLEKDLREKCRAIRAIIKTKGRVRP